MESIASSKPVKPLLRGYLHQAAFFCSIGAGFMLITMAPTSLSQMAATIYVLSLTSLYGISALYHRPYWTNMSARQWLRKLDHSSIFFMIAGSATPIFLLGTAHGASNYLVWILWSAALLGTLKCFLWSHAPKFLNVALYVGMGWLAVPYVPQIQSTMGTREAVLLTVGGVIYILGALVYFFRKPDPFPRFFGFHEIFHAMVVIASIVHFKVVYDLIRAAH